MAGLNKVREEIRRVLSEYASFRSLPFHEKMALQYEESEFEMFLRESLEPKVVIDEGLISSAKPELAYQIFRRIAGDSNVTFIKQRGSFFIKILEMSESDMKRLINSLNQMGYFISEIITIVKGKLSDDYRSVKYSESELDKAMSNRESLDLLTIQVNGKYINQVEDIPRFIYHLTSSKNVENIMQLGLIPKSKAKRVAHPERIYFATTLEAARALEGDFKKYYGDDMAVLKVSTNGLKNVKFYVDPDFAQFGIFTLDNIPREAIQK